MKYCPICQERYDEEIIKFCTIDGTPLVDEDQPSFTALPSENLEEPDDSIGEETVIRRKPVADVGSYGSDEQSERIVIPTSPAPGQQVKPRASQAYYPPPPPANTGKTIVLTIIGTLAVLAFGAALFWFLQKESPANVNTNINANLANQNINLNTNLGFDSNFNFNAIANFNINTNLNANLRTPTPTPTPRPSPTPSATPNASPTPSPSPTVRPAANIRPSPSATPRTGPRPPMMTNRPAGNNN
jgi:hypothetical protein